jgi:hypothetical protein
MRTRRNVATNAPSVSLGEGPYFLSPLSSFCSLARANSCDSKITISPLEFRDVDQSTRDPGAKQYQSLVFGQRQFLQ